MTSITCPKCHRTSSHPEDARTGYCGHCHEFTTPEVGAHDGVSLVSSDDLPWPADDESHPDFSTRRAATLLGLFLADLDLPRILPGEPLPAGVRDMLFEANGISLRNGAVFYGPNGEPLELPTLEAFGVVQTFRESHQGGPLETRLRTRLTVPILISTAYLGVDMGALGPLPLVWETLVVVGAGSAREILQPWRYATMAAAQSGHRHIVRAVRRGIGEING